MDRTTDPPCSRCCHDPLDVKCSGEYFPAFPKPSNSSNNRDRDELFCSWTYSPRPEYHPDFRRVSPFGFPPHRFSSSGCRRYPFYLLFKRRRNSFSHRNNGGLSWSFNHHAPDCPTLYWSGVRGSYEIAGDPD